MFRKERAQEISQFEASVCKTTGAVNRTEKSQKKWKDWGGLEGTDLFNTHLVWVPIEHAYIFSPNRKPCTLFLTNFQGRAKIVNE